MASEKNITMKEFNGTDYDTLYPKTKTGQVIGLQEQIDKAQNNAINQINPSLLKFKNKNIEPIGTVKLSTRTDLGPNWLKCNGATIDKTQYPELSNLLPEQKVWIKTASTMNGFTGDINKISNIYNLNGTLFFGEKGDPYETTKDFVSPMPFWISTNGGLNWTKIQLHNIYTQNVRHNGVWVNFGYNGKYYYGLYRGKNVNNLIFNYVFYSTSPSSNWKNRNFGNYNENSGSGSSQIFATGVSSNSAKPEEFIVCGWNTGDKGGNSYKLQKYCKIFTNPNRDDYYTDDITNRYGAYGITQTNDGTYVSFLKSNTSNYFGYTYFDALNIDTIQKNENTSITGSWQNPIIVNINNNIMFSAGYNTLYVLSDTFATYREISGINNQYITQIVPAGKNEVLVADNNSNKASIVNYVTKSFEPINFPIEMNKVSNISNGTLRGFSKTNGIYDLITRAKLPNISISGVTAYIKAKDDTSL